MDNSNLQENSISLDYIFDWIAIYGYGEYLRLNQIIDLIKKLNFLYKNMIYSKSNLQRQYKCDFLKKIIFSGRDLNTDCIIRSWCFNQPSYVIYIYIFI